MNTKISKVGYPLHITISSLFISLILGIGLVLTWQNYSKTSEIILSSADHLYDQASQEMLLDFTATYKPVRDALQLLALSPIAAAGSLEQRLEELKTISVALQGGQSVASIQVGYANGDYFVVRSVAADYMREKFTAPDGAVFMADHIETGANGQRVLVRLFFDENLRELQRLPATATAYDPRTRPWYSAAGDKPAATSPYLFYFIGKVGATITMKTPVPGVVIASDITLDQLSNTVRRHQITPGSEIVLIGADGNVFAYRDTEKLIQVAEGGDFKIAHLTSLDSDVLAYLAGKLRPVDQSLDFNFSGQRWIGSVRKIAKSGDVDLFALMVSPVKELLSEAIKIGWTSIIITACIILLAIPIVWFVARRISGPMRDLAGEADLISRFDFSRPIQTRSMISEVHDLAAAMEMMKNTINRFLTLITSLAGEKNFDSLLQRTAQETMSIGQADGVLTYLINDKDGYLEPGILLKQDHGSCSIDQLPRYSMDGDSELARAAKRKESSLITLKLDQEDGLASLRKIFSVATLTLIAHPLRNRQEEIIGVLCLLYREQMDNHSVQQQDGHIAFVQALSGFAAVSLESRQLLMMQQALLEAFIKLIAGAIDAKSPYTGGHCQRVPEITRMLAAAACQSDAPPFRDFQLSDEQWEALHIASWLHDCGKVTTPEYVVDKSTKLETISDRIHEVRMRFEVLKRDAEIQYWQKLTEGGNREILKPLLDDALRQLDNEFAFVAECNEGGEFMDPERM